MKMAQEDGSSWWSSWTTGILENVREKTTTALELVQSDLSEFVSTIQHDTSVVIADSATAVNRNIKVDESEKEATSGKLKQGFSDILTSISTSLHQAADNTSKPTYSQDENKTNEQRSTISVMPAVYDRTQARLQEMQTNPETYRNDPDSDSYQTWSKIFNLDSKKGEISELLVNNPDVRRLYTNFVPSVQSHSTFWHRYFYKVHEIETENKRLADIVARASQNDSSDWGWDDEDDEDITTSTATPKDDDFHPSPDSNVTTEEESRHDVLHQDSKCVVDLRDTESRTLPPNEINAKQDSVVMDAKLDSGKQSETEKNIVDDDHPRSASTSDHVQEDVSKNTLLPASLETKSEGEKSDSSDSNSWIRVSDKEGTGTSSSSSVVVVSEKDKELDSDEQANNDDDDDDDDDFDFNEDISNEEVEKLVQSITANELDSGEEDWDDWE